MFDFLKTQAERAPEAIALLAPGRPALTYGRLLRLTKDVIGLLNQLGIGRNDRVAVVLPNGPEMAAAFLAISSGATSAPLNPAYLVSEFDFYLSDLKAKALVTLKGVASPAIEAAKARGLSLIELVPEKEEPAGLFKLTGERGPLASKPGFARPDDIALVLHTSGTTSKPKIVPLTHANICTSAENIRSAYGLNSSDRCLNIMPLFHIHGLIGAILASVCAGASIVCTTGFEEKEFFRWVEDFRPTWYTAVPTMHQTVLTRAGDNRKIISQCRLRFIRSCSSALPPKLMAELERVFEAPVLEAYGMTEASHQIASNPLPPKQRKAGSVGVATGPEMAIMDETGRFLPAGAVGEIVIKGANVTAGYENNPEANKSSFLKDWFRTGDQGRIDGSGYLFITGRLKEIINRGGEKIAPREVEDALLGHPDVAQAVAFSVPHPKLGEDIIAAVVLKEKAAASERAIRGYTFARLADFKVPSQILILDRLPKGPTGKLQRIGLGEKLAPLLWPLFVPPRSSTEVILAKAYAEALGLAEVGVHDNFFSLGGDSISAMRAMARVRTLFQVEVPLPAIFRAPTVEQLAEIIEQRKWPVLRSSLVLLQDGGSEPPIFCLPGTLGNVFTDLGALARYLGNKQPVYGFQDGFHNPFTIEALANRYVGELRLVQSEGPYCLIGVCSGGAIAFEMARQLWATGQETAFLALVEPTPPYERGLQPYLSFAAFVLGRFGRRFSRHSSRVPQLSPVERSFYFRLRWKVISRQWALRRYLPRPYPGAIHMFMTGELVRSTRHSRLGWAKLALGGARIHEIPGTHGAITGLNDTPVDEACMKVIAEKIRVLAGKVLPDD